MKKLRNEQSRSFLKRRKMTEKNKSAVLLLRLGATILSATCVTGRSLANHKS